MTAATPWYQAPLVTSDAPVVIGILAIIATVWATFRAAKPRRGLVYRVVSSRSIIDGDSEEVHALKGNYRARILEIRLDGRGRYDIPSSAFNDGQPIIIYMNYGEILMLFDKPTSIPIERSPPKAELITNDPAAPGVGRLAVGPGLIGRDQIIIYKVVAQSTNRPADVPVLGIRHSLIDVQVKPRLVEPNYTGFVLWIICAAILAGIAEVEAHTHLPSLVELSLGQVIGPLFAFAVFLPPLFIVISWTSAWVQKRVIAIRRRFM
jgi:hypothetical protein